MSDRTGERCDWCMEGTFHRIGTNSYLSNVNEVIYKCDKCHHEVPGYETRGDDDES